MTERPVALTDPPDGYREWLDDLKVRVHDARQRAALAVNTEMLRLYWQIGHDILVRQAEQGWGHKVVERLSHDLRATFPDMKGFSRTNLMYMRAFADAWTEDAIVQQAVGRLPWSHNIVLLTKLGTPDERLVYAEASLRYGWSRNVLTVQVEREALERRGRAITTFESTLPTPKSDLARESLKDPYRFDFLGLGDYALEREIENALVQHVTEFLLELGAGFAYVGRQVHVEVGKEDFYLDLLFYHLELRRYVVIELKAGQFKPEYIGQLGFYLTAVDAQVRHEQDGATIGLLLCKGKDKVVAEYALRGLAQPLGVAEYQLVDSLPEQLQVAMPTIEQIEAKLQGGVDK